MMHVHTWGESTHAQNTDSVWPEWDRHREKVSRWIGMASEHLYTLGQAQSQRHTALAFLLWLQGYHSSSPTHVLTWFFLSVFFKLINFIV